MLKHGRTTAIFAFWVGWQDVMILAKIRSARPRGSSSTLLILSVHGVRTASAARDRQKPSSLEELRTAIQAELNRVGFGFARLISGTRDGTSLTDGIGIVDRAPARLVDATGYCRLGSISVSIIGLAALILEESGSARLTEIVSELAPRTEIRTEWDDWSPLCLVRQLEHAADLDELHYNDFASNDRTLPPPCTSSNTISSGSTADGRRGGHHPIGQEITDAGAGETRHKWDWHVHLYRMRTDRVNKASAIALPVRPDRIVTASGYPGDRPPKLALAQSYLYFCASAQIPAIPHVP